MDSWFPVLIAAALVGAGWWWYHERLKHERKRLEAYLEWLASGGVPERMAFLSHGSLSSLMVPLERVTSELARLRQQAQEKAFNLQSILESMEEGVMIVDDRHVLRLVNPSFIRHFQLKRDPVGLTILHTLRNTSVEEIVTAVLKSGEAQNGEFSTNGGKPARHFAVHAVPMRDTMGRPTVLTIFRDVSRLKQLEQVRREFVANVSHELRTPLSIFHGYVENLLDFPDLPREDLTNILQILKRHSNRLNALLEDLLHLARLESRTEKLHIEAIEIPEFLQTVTKDWSGKVGQKGVMLSVDVPANLPPLPADPLRLEQVICNLLENALKYTSANGRITVSAREESDALVLRVSDDGAGILPADLPHIFERFYRADKARSRDQGGRASGSRL